MPTALMALLTLAHGYAVLVIAVEVDDRRMPLWIGAPLAGAIGITLSLVGIELDVIR